MAKRKCRPGLPDEWELQKEAWGQYDPVFHHISTRAHQSATEKRPKPKYDAHQPYDPCPAPVHVAFRRVRRDLTADSCILALCIAGGSGEIAHWQLMVLVFRLLRHDEGIAGGRLKFGWSSARVCGDFPWWLGRGDWQDCTWYGIGTWYGIDCVVFLFLRIGALFEF